MKISLCIPTNGVVEWISHVIDSIYSQNVPLEKFEVVIVDNGDNPVFFDYMQKKMDEYSNIKYKRIKCPIFMSEIEAYKMAEGDFIKFVNHRTVLLDGTLDKWIYFMNENYESKPVVYFANGVLDKYYTDYYYDSFDEFVGDLSYYSSWSTGMAMWKEDLDGLEMENVNELFPHTAILFKHRKDRQYIIDNKIYLEEVPHSSQKKGRYDLFYAFAVEYPALLLELQIKGDIQIETFLKLKEENLDFITEIYNAFCVENGECSYDLSSYEKSINVFYSNEAVSNRMKMKEDDFHEKFIKRLERVGERSDVKVVYGAGKIGREFVMENGDEDIVCFVDRSKYKHGKLILGIPVISYEEFEKMNIDAKIVICVNKNDFCEVEEKLIKAEMDYLYWNDL